MRQRLDEPRQVRKEAAVITIGVCCGVPGLFWFHSSVLKERILIINKFQLSEFAIVTRNECHEI